MERRQTVLVADDDEGVRTLCRLTLEMDGFDVVEAGRVADIMRVGIGPP